MYIAAFALLTAAGAWGAWHSSPAYSTKRTLLYLMLLVLGAATTIAAMVIATDLTAGSSEAVKLCAAFGVTGCCTLGMIWLIVSVSVTKPPAPASASSIVTVHRARLVPWARRFGWLVLGCGLLATILPGDWKAVVYAVGGLSIFLGIVLLFTGYLAALNFDRSLSSVESEPWVHWRYAPDQWKAWGNAEVARLAAAPSSWSWRTDWKRFATSLAVLAVVVFALNSRTVPWQWNLGTVAIAGFTMFGFVALSQHYGKTAPYRLRRVLSSAAPEAFFGDMGVYADGIYTEWRTIGGYLVDASIDERSPRSLALLFEKCVGAANPMSEVAQNVLIPPGAAGDLALLQANIAAACPSARVAIV